MGLNRNLRVERSLGDWMRARLPSGLAEFVMFVLKQGWACLFGMVLLGLIILSSLIWQDNWAIARYDMLFIFALTCQVLLLALRLETLNEAKVILLFHIVGTVMEIFKISQGSWSYPEAGFFKIAGVPMFSGFMYAAVGSYIARVIRVFDMRFAPYPPFWMSVVLAVLIYGNFFWHHYWIDIRVLLFALTLGLFLRTRIWFFIGVRAYWMPMPVAAFFTAFFLWIAENIGTMTGTWVYHGQLEFELVRLGKLGSWYLLLYISFVLVTLVSRDALLKEPFDPKA